MVRHVVMLALEPEAEGATRDENARRLKERLEALPALIPQIRSFEVGLDLRLAAGAWDAVLVSTFDGAADLATYLAHPEHVRVAEWVGRVCARRAVVDHRLP